MKMNMGASLDKTPAESDAQCPTRATFRPLTEISSLIPLPSEIRTQTQSTNEPPSRVLDILICHSEYLQKDTELSEFEVKKASDYVKYIREFVRTPEEIEVYELVRNQVITLTYRSKNNAECEKEAKLSSKLRQTIDALYKRLQENLTVAEAIAECEAFMNLSSQNLSVEDKESLFKAKGALLRALKEAEAKEQAAAWASSGSQDPQPPLIMSKFLKSAIKRQIMNLTLTKDREAILTLGYKGAQAGSEQRLAQARKEYEAMLNGEQSQDQKEVEVTSDEEPVTTQPQADPQVIVKYLEFKLQSRESEIESLNIKLVEQTKEGQKTISELTEELEASKKREEQLRIENEELKRNPLVDQSLPKYVDELSRELSSTTDILNATQFEAVRLRMKLEKTEKLVEEMKARIEFEEKKNCEFKDEVVNLEVLIQKLQINNEEKAYKFNTQTKQLEKDLNTEKRQNALLKAENEELVTCNAKLDAVRKEHSAEIVELRGVCEASISCSESKIQELTLNAERVEKLHQEVEAKLLSKIEEVNGLEEENQKLVEKNEELEKSHNSDQTNISDLKSKILRISAENIELQRDSELKIKELGAKVYRAEENVRQMNATVENRNEMIRKLHAEKQKLSEQNENSKKTQVSDQSKIDGLNRKLDEMEAEYKRTMLNSNVSWNKETENIKEDYERKLKAKASEHEQLEEVNRNKMGALTEAYENLATELSQQKQLFSSKLGTAERKIDVLSREVSVSEETVKELKEVIKMRADEHRKLNEDYEYLERDYNCFQETSNSNVENLKFRLRKANAELSLEQDKLKHAETSIECLRKADIELSNELKQCVLEKSETEEKLKAELKKVTESLEKSCFEAVDAEVQRRQLKDTIGLMDEQLKELMEEYKEKSRLLAAIQKEKKEKQLEKDELEEQGYELFEF